MIDDDDPVFPLFCCNLERSYDYSTLYTVYNQNPTNVLLGTQSRLCTLWGGYCLSYTTRIYVNALSLE